jgi:hypothetical protein
MYVRIMLTLLVAATAFIAVRLAIPSRSVPVSVSTPGVAEAALDGTIDSLEFNATPAEQAVKVIEQKTGIHIVVNWDSLVKRGVSPQSPVTASLQYVAVSDALHAILQAGNKDWRLTSNSLGDTLTLSVLDDVPRYRLSVRVYDVRDLLTDEYWGAKSEAAAATEIDRLNSLTGLVDTYVRGERLDIQRLDDTGPPTPHVTGFAGKLIVSQTTEGHRRVEHFLAWLRRMR